MADPFLPRPLEEMAQIVRECKGMYTVAAQRLGISVQRMQTYGRKYETIRDAREAALEERLDTAELALWRATQEGQPWAIQFTLKMLGKERGYVERMEKREEVIHGSIEEWERHLQQAHAALAERRVKNVTPIRSGGTPDATEATG